MRVCYQNDRYCQGIFGPYFLRKMDRRDGWRQDATAGQGEPSPYKRLTVRPSPASTGVSPRVRLGEFVALKWKRRLGLALAPFPVLELTLVTVASWWRAAS